MIEAKPYDIPKQIVWEAYKRVKAKRGAAGVDGETLAAFEKDLKGNLYKIWNRMSSGSYMPPPVRQVEIPKANGGVRPLGIPTVADRAQRVEGELQSGWGDFGEVGNDGERWRRARVNALKNLNNRDRQLPHRLGGGDLRAQLDQYPAVDFGCDVLCELVEIKADCELLSLLHLPYRLATIGQFRHSNPCARANAAGSGFG